MDIFQSIALGIVQGLGEFLPISSTAHLILFPYFFEWEDPGLAFDVALHVGTLFAVLAFFWKDWINIFKLAFEKKIQNSKCSKFETQKYGKNILWFLAVATVPGVLAGYFLEDKAETVFRHPLLIAFALAVVGLILLLADKQSKKNKNLQNISVGNALLIGMAQALAVIPGVSRSGATITAGLFLGLDRVSAARFSFLLSTPVILGAAALKIPYLIQNVASAPLILGVSVSAVSGYLAIKYLLKFVEKASYAIFFWYRLFLAVLITAVYFLR